VAPVNAVPRAPLVALTADSGGTASLSPDADEAKRTSDNSIPPPHALSPKEQRHAARRMSGRKAILPAGARGNTAQERAEATRRAAERAAQAAEEACIANEQAQRAQQEARLAVARAKEADEAAERVREAAAAAQRIGRSLGTFFRYHEVDRAFAVRTRGADGLRERQV